MATRSLDSQIVWGGGGGGGAIDGIHTSLRYLA